MSEGPSWAEERSRVAAEQAAALKRAKDAEHAKAAAILRQFTEVALERGLPAKPLTVKGFGGKGRARTNVTGWPLRRDETIALGTDGLLYRLTADLSVFDRFRTVELTPIDPPLVIGAGGRDGDSISLVDALERILPGWRS